MYFTCCVPVIFPVAFLTLGYHSQHNIVNSKQTGNTFFNLSLAILCFVIRFAVDRNDIETPIKVPMFIKSDIERPKVQNHIPSNDLMYFTRHWTTHWTNHFTPIIKSSLSG